MGRPKCYEREEAVERALVLFREQGYVGTSVNGLVKATGVNRYSLYETFGDKRGLFLEVLAQFQAKKLHEAKTLFCQPGPKVPLFRRYFEIIKENGQRNGPVNCLVTTSAVNLAKDDPRIAEQLQAHFLALEEIFVRILSEAQASGEINPEMPLLQVARALINAGRGMRIIAQFEGFNETIGDIVEVTLGILRPTVAFQNGRSE